jgi:hypothetical protein
MRDPPRAEEAHMNRGGEDMADDTLDWFRRTCPPGAHFNAARGFYYPKTGERAAISDRDGKTPIRAALAQRLASKPIDLVRFTQQQEAASRERRARRAQSEQFLRESRVLRAAAERRLEAPLTDQGQIVAALRRGL